MDGCRAGFLRGKKEGMVNSSVEDKGSVGCRFIFGNPFHMISKPVCFSKVL